MAFQKQSLSKYWAFFLLVASVVLLTNCIASSPYIEWEYIVPDGYQGHLAIRYDCTGGTPLTKQDNIIRIEFAIDGTYCTSDSYTPSRSSGNRAWNVSGTPIPIVHPPTSDEKGYVLCCGGTLVTGGDPKRNLDEDIVLWHQWVGDMNRVKASWPSTPDSLFDFLYDRFGI